MSLAETGMGMAAIAGALHLAVSAILPAPLGITVHSLSYVSGIVTQERTVAAAGAAFYAQWAASVIDVATGETLCAGSGAAAYTVGHKAAKYRLATWTGDANCTPDILEPGRLYALQAVWAWGDKSVSASQEFVK